MKLIMKLMKNNISHTAIMTLLAAAAAMVMLSGCQQSGSDAPKAGYPGGQKAGAVNNQTTTPGYPGANSSGSPSGDAKK